MGELNDFLVAERRNRWFAHPLTRRAAIKDVIESLGVLHTEIGSIHIDGVARGLATVLDAHSRARVVVRPIAVGHAAELRPRLPRPARFVLDIHLGRLARDLRLLGFDTRYHNDYDDADLAAVAAAESRILLTRDRGLIKRTRVVFARFVRADDPFEQLIDVFIHFRLPPEMAAFTRCSHCNTPLEPIRKAAIVHRLEPGTRQHYRSFSHCPGCDRLFWRGSHHRAMQQRIARLLRSAGSMPHASHEPCRAILAGILRHQPGTFVLCRFCCSIWPACWAPAPRA